MIYEVVRMSDKGSPVFFMRLPAEVGSQTVFTLTHTVQKFTDRVEFKWGAGFGFDSVSLFPDAIAAFQAIRKMKNNLVVFKFEPAKNDTVVYETTQGAHSVMNGIAFQAGPGESFRVHVSVMGQHIAFLVDSQQLLIAIAELGGDPE